MRLMLLILAVITASPALAWGEYGHRTTASIALKTVKPGTRRAIAELIKNEAALRTPTCALTTLQDASVWPDCIRGLAPRFDYTSTWHYQNVDICKPFALPAACDEGNCVSRQIERAARRLKNKALPARERLMSLAFLTHFVGDIHMPLHAGDRGDRGGNDVKIAYGLFEGRMNLHWLWDGPLAERAITTPPRGATGILGEIKADEVAKLAAGSVTEWSRESWALSRDLAYTSALGTPCSKASTPARIDNATIKKLLPPVRLQILKAGVRLARLLDTAFE